MRYLSLLLLIPLQCCSSVRADGLCEKFVQLAKSRELLDHSIDFTNSGQQWLSYEIDVDKDGKKDRFESKCGYSRDAECEFTLDLSSGGRRKFFDSVGSRLIDLGGSVYQVYGVSYNRDKVCINYMRVVKLDIHANTTYCAKE